MSEMVDEVKTHSARSVRGRCRAAGRCNSSTEEPHRAFIDLCRRESLVPAAQSGRAASRVHAAARLRLVLRGRSTGGAGLQANRSPGTGDAGRSVPERDEDAQPRSAGVHGPGRKARTRTPRGPCDRRPTPTPTASAACEPLAGREGHLPLHHRKRNRIATDALQTGTTRAIRVAARFRPSSSQRK